MEKTTMNQQLRRLKYKHEKVLLFSVYKQYRDKYYEEFKMTDLQFELVWNFFVTHADKREMNLSKECIETLMNASIRRRTGLVKATEVDVRRALEILDVNQNGRYDMDEFVQLVSLFFASSRNFKERIEGVLNNKSHDHMKKGFLTDLETCVFQEWLSQFYGKPNEEERCVFEENYNSYAQIAELLSEKLKSYLFC